MSAENTNNVAGHPPATKAGGMRVGAPVQHTTALAKMADDSATPKTGVEVALATGPVGAGKLLPVDANGGALAGKLHGNPFTKATASTYTPPEPQHQAVAGKQVKHTGKVADFQPQQRSQNH